MKTFILCCGVLLVLFGCQNNSVTPAETESKPQLEEIPKTVFEQTIGEWETERLTVYVIGKDGTNENDTVIAEKEDFPKMLGIKTARGYYFEDGAYRDEYIGINDSVMGATEGTWTTDGDTLVVTPTDSTVKTYRYYTTFPSANEISYFGLIDWDGDGEDDDVMIGVSRRIVAE